MPSRQRHRHLVYILVLLSCQKSLSDSTLSPERNPLPIASICQKIPGPRVLRSISAGKHPTALATSDKARRNVLVEKMTEMITRTAESYDLFRRGF